jgi:hypothetical protein
LRVAVGILKNSTLGCVDTSGVRIVHVSQIFWVKCWLNVGSNILTTLWSQSHKPFLTTIFLRYCNRFSQGFTQYAPGMQDYEKHTIE